MPKPPLSEIKRIKRLQELDRPLTQEEQDEYDRLLDHWDRLNLAADDKLRHSEGQAK